MKNIIISITLTLCTLFLSAQVELKGYTLSEVYTGPVEVMTTLGGIEGVLHLSTLKDGRLYSITFTPSDGVYVKRLYHSEVETIKKGMENKFGFIYSKFPMNDNSDDYWLKEVKDGVAYICSVKIREFKEFPCVFTLFIFNTELQDIYEKEEQDKADKDF